MWSTTQLIRYLTYLLISAIVPTYLQGLRTNFGFCSPSTRALTTVYEDLVCEAKAYLLVSIYRSLRSSSSKLWYDKFVNMWDTTLATFVLKRHAISKSPWIHTMPPTHSQMEYFFPPHSSSNNIGIWPVPESTIDNRQLWVYLTYDIILLTARSCYLRLNRKVLENISEPLNRPEPSKLEAAQDLQRLSNQCAAFDCRKLNYSRLENRKHGMSLNHGHIYWD